MIKKKKSCSELVELTGECRSACLLLPCLIPELPPSGREVLEGEMEEGEIAGVRGEEGGGEEGKGKKGR